MKKKIKAAFFSLVSLTLAGCGEENKLGEEQQKIFFQTMKMGDYKCNPVLCEIKDKKDISLDERNNYQFTMLLLSDTTGFVEHITPKSEHIYEVNVNWDDGSGKSNREIIHVQSLGSSCFLITDSHGQRNLMEFVSAN